MHSLCRHVRALSTRVRYTRTNAFVDTLLRETHEPVFRVLAAMRDNPAFQAKVTVPDYERWRPFIHSRGLGNALEEMKGDAGPVWLALYLLAYRIRSQDDAYPAAVDLTYAHLASAPNRMHGPLLIFLLASLARFNLLLPIRRVIDTFLTVDLSPYSELYFNLFIQALTTTPTQCTETADAIVNLLRRMETRQLELNQDTYDLLLNDKLVTIHLAHFLRFHMTSHATVPTTAQLEAYMRIFAKKDAADQVAQLHSALHLRSIAPTDSHHQDALLLAARRDHADHPLDRAQKLLLGVRADHTPALNFLKKLLKPKFHPKPKPSFNLKSLNLNAPKLTILPTVSPKPDIHSFTAALSSLSADRRATASAIVALFESARSLPTIIPNVVTYTVLLQALYDRGEWDRAVHYWDEYHNSGLPMDRLSLGIGMKILTRAGRPHAAFGLLQEWAYRLNLSKPDGELLGVDDGLGAGGSLLVEGAPSDSPSPSASDIPPASAPAPRSFDRVSVSIITLNDWLVALNRISRPDVVLAAWDALRPLYNVSPDARTLAILLASTRRALRLNETNLKAMAVRMGYEIRDTLGFGVGGSASGDTPDPAEARVDMAEAEARLSALLGPPAAAHPAPYAPALWHGRLPADHARLLFLQALCGAARDPRALMAVDPPARATRRRAPSEEGEEGWGLAVGLPRWREEGVDTWVRPGWGVLLRRRRVLVRSRAGMGGGERRIWEEEEDRVGGGVETGGVVSARDGAGVAMRDQDGDQVRDQDQDQDQDWQWESYHPSIIPTHECFLHYILLLALTGRASEIARVLAWMRHLKIRPQRSTLGLALVLWGEICGRPVLIEDWTRRRNRLLASASPPPGPGSPEAEKPSNKDEPPWMRGPLGAFAKSDVDLALDEERERVLAAVEAPREYQRLVNWLHEWVPVQMMPGPRSLAMWTRNVARLRDGARPAWEVEQGIRETQEEEETL